VSATRVCDAHSDLLTDCAVRAHEADPFGRRWLPALRAGGVGLQVAAVYADPHGPAPERQLAAFERIGAAHPEAVTLVRTRAELEASRRAGTVGLVLALEGLGPLDGDPRGAERWWERGVRAFGLTWSDGNAFAGGCAGPPARGLTPRGRELLARLAGLGAAVDLAHASDATCADVLERWTGPPPLVSHTGCRSLVPIARNAPDEVLREVGRRGGVVGIMALAFAVAGGRAGGLSSVADHVDHARAVAGRDGVGLGTDFCEQVEEAFGPGHRWAGGTDDGSSRAVAGLESHADLPALVRHLAGRGLPDPDLRAVAGGNLERALRCALPA